jgi:2-polyprenyl-3-methyl-5-hydroxy-6-metoxy-1,4-benzoquinol methylase
MVMLGCKSDQTESAIEVVQVTSQSTIKDDEDDTRNLSRAIWQKPGLVIEKLGDISNKVIADIGAGTGYFSFKLAPKASKVIAIDIEPRIIEYLDSIKNTIPNIGQKMENRLGKPNDPLLLDNEADIVLIINTIAYINDPESYLKILKKGLKHHGKLMIIDYKMKKLPINAPPKSERIYLDKLEDILISSGYDKIESDDTSLDYQYIITAININ